MSKEIPLYEWSRKDAIRLKELAEWQLSYEQNCDCARNIERAIHECYKNNSLSDKGAKVIVGKFGWDRTMWVLANTIQQSEYDGRYSKENKEWAKRIFIPLEENRLLNNYVITSHAGLVNLFANQVRKAWDSLNLFGEEHCYDETIDPLDFRGKVVVVKPKALKDEYKTPEFQLFLATSGKGCIPASWHEKIHGQHLKNGAKATYLKREVFGVIKLEHLPDWAKEKYNEMTSQDEQENEEINIGEQT